MALSGAALVKTKVGAFVTVMLATDAFPFIFVQTNDHPNLASPFSLMNKAVNFPYAPTLSPFTAAPEL